MESSPANNQKKGFEQFGEQVSFESLMSRRPASRSRSVQGRLPTIGYRKTCVIQNTVSLLN